MGKRGPAPIYDRDDEYAAVRLPKVFLTKVDAIAQRSKSSRSKVLRDHLLRTESELTPSGA